MTEKVRGCKREDMTRADAIAGARRQLDSGEFLAELDRRVAYRTESQNPERRDALRAYLEQDLQPAFARLGFSSRLIESPTGKCPYLVADYREDASAPTVLMYGHGDVVDGMEGEWRDNLDPWRATISGNRVYGRGTADNKGQHSINLSALSAVREARGGRLGFNARFIIETGEEIGSPDLRQVCETLRDELKADLFLASDGPRLSADRPTIFLGCRGGIRIHLDVKLRDGSHHSGNWGGVLANPATILAGAIATLVDGKGRLLLDRLKPPRISNQIRATLADVKVEPTADEPALSENWGEEGLSAAERLYAWNTLEVLAMSSGNIESPANAIPGEAHAVLQLALRRRHQGREHRRRGPGASARPRVSDGRGQRLAGLCRLANRFRQSMGRLGGGIDPAHHRKGARGAAEFRRRAAQRRVLRGARPAHDLGAALLSGLLAARSQRTHSSHRHRGSAGHHGRPVLGSRRDAAARTHETYCSSGSCEQRGSRQRKTRPDIESNPQRARR